MLSENTAYAKKERKDSMFEKVFKLSENKTTVKTEVVAGLTTFMTMAYILAVNPSILSAAGMDSTAVLVATALASFIGTVAMGLMANLPFALSAGMGLNAYLAYTVCGAMGYSWQVALLAVFVEGLIFVVLSLTNVREAIFNAIPLTLKRGVSVGIGLFIAFIGFKNAGLITGNQYTFVQFVDISGAFKNAETAFDGWCAIAPAVVTFLGFIIIAVLTKRNVKGSVLIGILASAVLYYVATWQVPTFDLSSIGQAFKDFGTVGITALSAGSSTEPGGYAHKGQNLEQWTVNDARPVDEVVKVMEESGFDAVFHNASTTYFKAV